MARAAQGRVLTVSDKSEDYGRQVLQEMTAAGLRITGDFRAEKLGAKIREGQLEMLPYMFVVGPRDAESGSVSVRDRYDGDLGAMPLAAAIERLQAEVEAKAVRQKIDLTPPSQEPTTVANEY